MLLSVVSALARLDVDPWEEAANLARLPKDAATQRLGALIAALPDGTPARPDPGTIAARLIPLLPRQASSDIRAREMLLGLGAASQAQVVRYLIFCTILLVLVVGFQWSLARHQAPPQPGNASTPVPAFSQVPPPNSRQ